MNTGPSTYKLVLVTNRTNCQLAEHLLKQAQINSLIKQDNSTEALSVVRGGAVLPFESWGIYVSENQVTEARQILDEGLPKPSPASYKESSARKAIKPAVWLFLFIFFGIFVTAAWFMIQYIIQSSKV